MCWISSNHCFSLIKKWCNLSCLSLLFLHFKMGLRFLFNIYRRFWEFQWSIRHKSTNIWANILLTLHLVWRLRPWFWGILHHRIKWIFLMKLRKKLCFGRVIAIITGWTFFIHISGTTLIIRCGVDNSWPASWWCIINFITITYLTIWFIFIFIFITVEILHLVYR